MYVAAEVALNFTTLPRTRYEAGLPEPPVPLRGPDRTCFMIQVHKAGQRKLSFVHDPG